MHVKVYQQDARQAMRGDCVRGGNRGVVQQAEAHCPVRRRMVAWRTDHGKAGVHPAVQDGVYRADGGSGSGSRRSP